MKGTITEARGNGKRPCLVIIFRGVFAATVSAGAGLFWYALRPDGVDSQPTVHR
jgi:hypothetical protein